MTRRQRLEKEEREIQQRIKADTARLRELHYLLLHERHLDGLRHKATNTSITVSHWARMHPRRDRRRPGIYFTLNFGVGQAAPPNSLRNGTEVDSGWAAAPHRVNMIFWDERRGPMEAMRYEDTHEAYDHADTWRAMCAEALDAAKALHEKLDELRAFDPAGYYTAFVQPVAPFGITHHDRETSLLVLMDNLRDEMK